MHRYAPATPMGPREVKTLFRQIQDHLHAKGKDRPPITVVLGGNYIVEPFATADHLMKRVAECTEHNKRFESLIMKGNESLEDQQWYISVQLGPTGCTVQTESTDLQWKHSVRGSLEAHIHDLAARRETPFRLAQAGAGAVALIMLLLEGSALYAGHISLLSALVLVAFVVALLLPRWALRPLIHLDERVQFRAIDLVPWITIAIHAAKLLELFWQRS